MRAAAQPLNHPRRARTALRRLGSLAVLALTAGLGGSVLAPAASAEVPTAGLTAEGPRATKGYFVLHASRGGSAGGTLSVANPTGRRETVRLAAVSAVTGQTTGAVYLAATDPRRDLATWMRLDRSKLVLGPHQRELVAFTVRLPSSARAGEHLAGIAAQTGRPSATKVARKGKGTFRVTLRQRTVVAVQVDVPGPITYRMALTGARAGPQSGFQTVLLGMRNDGDVLTKGRGRLVVSDSSGAPVKRLSFPVDTFVPATAIDYPAVVPGRALSAGSYVADVTLGYGHGQQARGRFPFTISAANLRQTYGSVLPPGVSAGKGGSHTVLLILAAVALLGAGFGGSHLLHRRRAQGAPGQPPRISG